MAMDGTVTLGLRPCFGRRSDGPQARQAVQQYLLRLLREPGCLFGSQRLQQQSLLHRDAGAGFGDGVYRFPMTGNETVLDAISQINGMKQVSSKRIWVARPSDNLGGVQRLEVSWEEITANANARSNYQLMPGDRVFVAEDRLIAFDTGLGKLIAPVERVMGFGIFGAGTVTRFSGRYRRVAETRMRLSRTDQQRGKGRIRMTDQACASAPVLALTVLAMAARAGRIQDGSRQGSPTIAHLLPGRPPAADRWCMEGSPCFNGFHPTVWQTGQEGVMAAMFWPGRIGHSSRSCPTGLE